MVFNSLSYFLFLPAVTALYYFVGHRIRWFLLLAASTVFYMSLVPAYVLVLAALIGVDYAAGILIERSRGPRRKAWLLASIAATCGVLFVFKYLDFFNANVSMIADMLGWRYSLESLSLILPVGLSFHTFQSLSYVIEVHAGRCRAERHLGIYSLYVMFFPQLVAGPIERPQTLLPQLRVPVGFDPATVSAGLKLILWGLFKKAVIADRLAIFVDGAYGSAGSASGGALALATVFFYFQVYCDFSGYTDMARGSARMLGIELSANFRFPYLAASVGDYWRRWHITLSLWLRDYVYRPLRSRGGLLASPTGAILATFLVSGLWHGASWKFVAWGLLNGAYLAIHRALKPSLDRFWRLPGPASAPGSRIVLGMATTFVLILMTRVFFRAENASEALMVLLRIAAWIPWAAGAVGWEHLISDFRVQGGLALITLLIALEFLQRTGAAGWALRNSPMAVRWAACYALLLGILFLGEFGSGRFVYFQF